MPYVTVNPPAGLTPVLALTLGNTGVSVKATPGKVYHCLAGNIATTAAYLKFYDMATAPAATDTPIYVVLIPAGGSQPVDIPAGLPFATGIGIRASKLQANADTTAPDGNVTVSLLYA